MSHSIVEGSSKIEFPPDLTQNEVFYNPVQIFNRDLSTLVIQGFQNIYQQDIMIFEAFAATGLRSIRYAKEITGIEQIISNDIDPNAVSLITSNIELNNVENIVKPSLGDASILLSTQRKAYDVIDIDPYSTAAFYIDGAVQAIKNGGLLCVTSTDGRSLCGVQQDTAYSWYHSMPMNFDFRHEFGIRILLDLIISAAARCGRSVEPLLCLSIDFYFRLFVRVHDKACLSKITAASTSLVFYSQSSASFWLQPMGIIQENKGNKSIKQAKLTIPSTTDPWTGDQIIIGGPIYSGPIQSPEFIAHLLEILPQMQYLSTNKRITAVLNAAAREIEVPLYYSFETLCGIAKSPLPRKAIIISALERLGFRTSLSHAKPEVIKTDAPPDAIWDLLKEWYKSTGKPLPEDSNALKLLTSESKFEISLEIDPVVKQRLIEQKKICKFY